jgi:hypothetical protein
MNRNNKYYQTHKEQCLKQMKIYRETHKEEMKEYKRKWTQEHKEQHNRSGKKYYYNHLEQEHKKRKQYRELPKTIEYLKQWRKLHWKEQLAKRKNRYHNDKEFHNRVINTACKVKKKILESRKAEIFTLLGGQCANPFGQHKEPYTDIRALQIDHVNGNGKKDIGSKCRTTYYRKVLEQIKNGSKDYQLLCANCNWIKRITNNEK